MIIVKIRENIYDCDCDCFKFQVLQEKVWNKRKYILFYSRPTSSYSHNKTKDVERTQMYQIAKICLFIKNKLAFRIKRQTWEISTLYRNPSIVNTFAIKDTIVSNSCEAFSANFGSFASTSHVLPLSLNHVGKIKLKWTKNGVHKMEEREYCAQFGCNRNLRIKPLLILAATEGYFFPWDHVHKFSWGIKRGNPKKSGIWKKSLWDAFKQDVEVQLSI